MSKTLSLRASVSSGYRAPTMFELLSHGVHEGTYRYEIGNSALKIENSYQADVSLNYKTRHLELFVNPYWNYIRHYIYTSPTGEIMDDLPVYRYVQDNSFLYGGEAGFHFHPHPWDWLHFSGSYSSTFGQDSHHNDLPLMPSQKLNATIRASFPGKKAIQSFSAFLQEQYSFAQNCVAAYETPTSAYNLINLGLTFELNINKQKILFNLAVDNLFNETYYDHLSRYKQYGIYNMGRNLNLQISVPFSASF
jgi:iron complex outermembrane receptor protein